MVVDSKDQNGNNTPTLGVPVKLNQTPDFLRTPPTNFGGDTRDVLAELDYSTDQINRLFEVNVV